MNLAVFAGVFVVQYGMGLIINAYPNEAGGGYAAEGYRTAFIAALGLEVGAFLWFLIPARPRAGGTHHPNVIARARPDHGKMMRGAELGAVRPRGGLLSLGAMTAQG